MAYRVSTLKKRPGVVSRVELGELDVQVVVRNRAELLDLLGLTTKVTVIIQEWLGDEIKKFRGVIWKSRKYDPRLEGILERLRDESSKVKVAVKTTAAATLELLSLDPSVFVRAAVARNPRCPLSILERLSEDADLLVRSEVARNRQSSAQLLEKLSWDLDWWVRYWTAARGPLSILERLSRDPVTTVRAGVARRKDCPLAILQRLSQDPQAEVRLAVALRTECPYELLLDLAQDSDKIVRRTASDQLRGKVKCII